MELLKQPLGKPMSLADKVITLCVARHKSHAWNSNCKSKRIPDGYVKLLCKCTSGIAREIEETKDLSKELSQKIVEIAEEFKKSRC